MCFVLFLMEAQMLELLWIKSSVGIAITASSASPCEAVFDLWPWTGPWTSPIDEGLGGGGWICCPLEKNCGDFSPNPRKPPPAPQMCSQFSAAPNPHQQALCKGRIYPRRKKPRPECCQKLCSCFCTALLLWIHQSQEKKLSEVFVLNCIVQPAQINIFKPLKSR